MPSSFEKGPSGQIFYEFSAIENYTVELLARVRQKNKEAHGVRSKRFDPKKSDLAIHTMGMRAEYAVASILGGLPKWELSVGGDSNSGDLVLFDGRSCSVKYRAKAGWDFALQSGDAESFKEDLGILVYPAPQSRTLMIHSWITREEFIKKYRTVDYGYGPRAVVPPGKMMPFSELVQEVRQKAR